MAGFGLRAFKRLKEESLHNEDLHKYFTHIVVGNNTLAVLKYLSLVSEYGQENVALITDTPISRETLEHSWRCSIHTIRDEERAKELMGFAPKLELTPVGQETLFYKDTKFHPFGGRAKPIALMAGEDQFQNAYYKAQWKNLFEPEVWEKFDEILAKQNYKFLNSIELSEPTDLVKRTQFKLHTGEFECYDCENLHWYMAPKKFVNLVKDKNLLSDDIKAYSSATEELPAVVVYFDCAGMVYDSEGTLFIPQSMTHEWGHFIFDFDKYNPETNSQSVRGLILLQEDEITSEELAKKIKLLKRVLERVLPDFGKISYTEHIRFDETMFIQGENKQFDHLQFGLHL